MLPWNKQDCFYTASFLQDKFMIGHFSKQTHSLLSSKPWNTPLHCEPATPSSSSWVSSHRLLLFRVCSFYSTPPSTPQLYHQSIPHSTFSSSFLPFLQNFFHFMCHFIRAQLWMGAGTAPEGWSSEPSALPLIWTPWAPDTAFLKKVHQLSHVVDNWWSHKNPLSPSKSGAEYKLEEKGIGNECGIIFPKRAIRKSNGSAESTDVSMILPTPAWC